jgi:serine/threonine protein kinase
MNQWKFKTLEVLRDKGELGGSVRLIEFIDSNEKYVIKQIPNLDSSLHRAIFDKEIKALRKLNASNNIVKLINHEYGTIKKAGTVEGRILLEYIEGETLQDANYSIDSVSTRFQIMQELIAALRYAHENGVIHRDINPSNIMISDDGVTKLIDFGICKIKGVIQKGTTYQFATNRYAAPEVGLHSENATEQSDIYSLGAVIYFLFTNKEPPLPDGFSDVISKATGIDVELKPILTKMTALVPSQRHESIVDLDLVLAPIFGKYTRSDERYIVTFPVDKFKYLRSKALVVGSKKDFQLLQDDIPNNFANAHMRTEDYEGQECYWFDGVNYSMQCIFVNNHFQVQAFRKLDVFHRERNKKLSLPVSGYLMFRNTIGMIADTYESFQLRNRVQSHTESLLSKENIDAEFDGSFGIWKEFIDVMISSAREQALKFNYDNYQFRDGLFAFELCEDSRIYDESINRDTMFIFESTTKKDKGVKNHSCDAIRKPKNHRLRRAGLSLLPDSQFLLITSKWEQILEEIEFYTRKFLKSRLIKQRYLLRLTGLNKPTILHYRGPTVSFCMDCGIQGWVL